MFLTAIFTLALLLRQHTFTPDEIADVSKLNVATVINGRVHAQNVVANMTFPPPMLVDTIVQPVPVVRSQEPPRSGASMRGVSVSNAARW